MTELMRHPDYSSETSDRQAEEADIKQLVDQLNDEELRMILLHLDPAVYPNGDTIQKADPRDALATALTQYVAAREKSAA